MDYTHSHTKNDPVDARKLALLARADVRLLAPVTRWHRVPQHLPHRLASQPELPRRLAFTHLVDDDLQNSSVKAANDGRVLCAKNLGIYGNCIVLDHGYGLQSIYGHLREIDVKEGDMVKKGQKMGIAGETGLAGGVHVHFSLQIEGVQVNSREWWDEHWIHNRITSKPIERTTPQTAASFTTSKVSAIPSLGIRIVWTRSLAEIVTTGTRSFHPAIFEEDIVMGSVDFSALSPRHFLTGLR